MRKTKLIIGLLLLSICILSCNGVVGKVKSIIDPHTELYQITDGFVVSLQKTYQTYGMFGGKEHTRYTKDGLYKIDSYKEMYEAFTTTNYLAERKEI